MKTYTLQSTETKTIETILCNGCGRPIGQNVQGYFDDYLSIEKQWGYHSSRDGQTYHLDLCEACFEKLLHSLAIPAKIS